MKKEIKNTATGFNDSKNVEFKVGSIVQKSTEINHQVHGNWVQYEIKLKGIIPYLSYIRSEKGEVLPKGYLAQLLSDLYDQKMLLFIDTPKRLIPIEKVTIIKE